MALFLREAVALDARRENGSYQDAFHGASRLGCRLRALGSFKQLGDTADPMSRMIPTLERHRWHQDLRYGADGPDGSDLGMRRLEVLCMVSAHWEGHDDSDTSTVKRPPTPEEDRYEMVTECAEDPRASDPKDVPESLWKLVHDAGLDSLVVISYRLQSPPYTEGDFDADGLRDVVVLVEERKTDKLGFVFIHRKTGMVVLAGAGRTVPGIGDDFSWMKSWDTVFRRTLTHMVFEPPGTPAMGDALEISDQGARTGFLAWNGSAYTWLTRPAP
jgi:hypothetical protein